MSGRGCGGVSNFQAGQKLTHSGVAEEERVKNKHFSLSHIFSSTKNVGLYCIFIPLVNKTLLK